MHLRYEVFDLYGIELIRFIRINVLSRIILNTDMRLHFFRVNLYF